MKSLDTTKVLQGVFAIVAIGVFVLSRTETAVGQTIRELGRFLLP